MAQTGNGSSISFSGSTFSASIISIGELSLSRESLQDTALSNSTFMSYVPSDLYSIDPVDLRFYFVPGSSDNFPVFANSTAETMTIAWNSSETLSGSGFWTNVTYPSHENGVLQEGSAQWQFDGKTGPVFSTTT